MGDSLPGLQARLMSQALRKLTATIKKTNTMVIFINQIRMKIGVMFGSPETTTGGNALKFYASVRLDIRRIGSIKKGEEVIGNETKVKVVKNKVSPPFKTAEFDILYGQGISREGEVIDMGVNHKILEKSGAWYAYNGEKIGQAGTTPRVPAREPRAGREIENKVREAVGIPQPPPATPRASETNAPAALAERAALQWLAQREHSRAEMQRKLLPTRAPWWRRPRRGAGASRRGTRAGRGDGQGGRGARLAGGPPVPLPAALRRVAHPRAGGAPRQPAHPAGTFQHGVVLDAASAQALKASEFDRAREVWGLQFAAPAADAAGRARQARFLVSRGFSAETVRRVLRPVGAGPDED